MVIFNALRMSYAERSQVDRILDRRPSYPVAQITRYIGSFLNFEVTQSELPPHFLYHLTKNFRGEGKLLDRQDRTPRVLLHPSLGPGSNSSEVTYSEYGFFDLISLFTDQ